MHRNRLAIVLTVSLLGACDDQITQPKMFPGGAITGAGGVAGDGGHVVPSPKCEGACCPADAVCSPTPATYSGPECLAQFDNSPPENRWQLRQTWSASVLPIGNAGSAISTVLGMRSEFTWPTCNMRKAYDGTFMQLVDFDQTAKVGRVGFAKYVPSDPKTPTDPTTAIANGLCMVEGTYDDPTHALPTNMAVPANWPPGLPQPMLLPFQVAPVNAKGLDVDFDLAKDRLAILAKFADGGEYKTAGFTGIFYLSKTGFLHGYAPLAYVIVYDSPSVYNAIPIREGEITARLNDVAHPNCVGVYRGDALSPDSNCEGSPLNPAWGCANGECPVGQAPNVTKGYFLITELEQDFNNTLGQSLCAVDVLNVPAPDNAWVLSGTTDCRSNPAWNPQAPATGLPKGDWCAATNSPATGTCHDAFRSISYAAFQGFRIQPTTCAPI